MYHGICRDDEKEGYVLYSVTSCPSISIDFRRSVPVIKLDNIKPHRRGFMHGCDRRLSELAWLGDDV